MLHAGAAIDVRPPFDSRDGPLRAPIGVRRRARVRAFMRESRLSTAVMPWPARRKNDLMTNTKALRKSATIMGVLIHAVIIYNSGYINGFGRAIVFSPQRCARRVILQTAPLCTMSQATPLRHHCKSRVHKFKMIFCLCFRLENVKAHLKNVRQARASLERL